MSLCCDIRSTRTSAHSTSNDSNLTRTGLDRHQLFATPTPSHGVRRRRGSNDDFDCDDIVVTRPAGTTPITPGTRKRLKASCEDTARLFDVDPDQLKLFAESPTLLHMFINLKAHLLKIENMFSKDQLDILLKSPEFRSGLQDRLLVSLLSPGIPAYVTDVTSRMLYIIKDQWRLFKVPKEIFEDPDHRSRLETMIEASFKDDGDTIHISVLVQRLFPKGVLSTTEHWTRIAFLRSALRDFVRFTGMKKPGGALLPLRRRPNPTYSLTETRVDDSESGSPTHGSNNLDNSNDDDENNGEDSEDDHSPITGKSYTQQQYWNYVDDYLDYIRTDLFADITDRATRNSKTMQLFSEALQIDIFNYRGGSKRPPPPSGQLPAWQEVLHRSACW